jgi:hypothetical protein
MSALFDQEFPKAKASFEELRQKPFCSICIKRAVTNIMMHDNYINKLGVLYGEDITLHKDLKKLLQWQKTERGRVQVETIPIHEVFSGKRF